MYEDPPPSLAVPRGEIYQKVKEILTEHCQVEKQISWDARLQEDLGLESMELMTLALEVENHWQLCLDESPDNPPHTVEEIVNLIGLRLQQKCREEE